MPTGLTPFPPPPLSSSLARFVPRLAELAAGVAGARGSRDTLSAPACNYTNAQERLGSHQGATFGANKASYKFLARLRSISYSVAAPVPIIDSTLNRSPFLPDSSSQYFLRTQSQSNAMHIQRIMHTDLLTSSKSTPRMGDLSAEAAPRSARHFPHHSFVLHGSHEAHLVENRSCWQVDTCAPMHVYPMTGAPNA